MYSIQQMNIWWHREYRKTERTKDHCVSGTPTLGPYRCHKKIKQRSFCSCLITFKLLISIQQNFEVLKQLFILKCVRPMYVCHLCTRFSHSKSNMKMKNENAKSAVLLSLKLKIIPPTEYMMLSVFSIYLFKIKNGNTGRMCEICLKLTDTSAPLLTSFRCLYC